MQGEKKMFKQEKLIKSIIKEATDDSWKEQLVTQVIKIINLIHNYLIC